MTTTTGCPPCAPVHKPAGHYHHGNLRLALIEAATQILEQDGVAGLSLRAIARRAGVSQAAPYRHFADKEAVLAAVAAEGFRALTRCASCATNGAATSGQCIAALGRGYVAFATQQPALFRLMFGGEITDKQACSELQEAGQAAYALIHDAMAQCLSQPDAAPLDPGTATITAWALMHGLATLLIDRQICFTMTNTTDQDALVEDITSILVNGLTGST